jgi:hypothetical protein
MWIPKHILCIVGQWTSLDQARVIVDSVGRGEFTIDEELSILHADDRMAQAFEACRDRGRPTWSDVDRALVATHCAVIYVISPPVLAKRAESISTTALQIIAALLRAGGCAAKGESAGIAHSRDEWIRLADAVTSTSETTTRMMLRDAFVRQPLLDTDGDVYYSCGMHLLGHRDLEMPAELDAMLSVQWFAQATATVLQQSANTSLVMQSVTLDLERRYLVDGGPCGRYQQDDFFYNPYGYWSLLESDDDDDLPSDAPAQDN